jgi:serine/threonine protein kinase
MQNPGKNNENNWIEEAKEYLRYYEYKSFNDVKKIGEGSYGKVYRARWKNSENYLALKSFLNSDKITIEKIVDEVIL